MSTQWVIFLYYRVLNQIVMLIFVSFNIILLWFMFVVYIMLLMRCLCICTSLGHCILTIWINVFELWQNINSIIIKIFRNWNFNWNLHMDYLNTIMKVILFTHTNFKVYSIMFTVAITLIKKIKINSVFNLFYIFSTLYPIMPLY